MPVTTNIGPCECCGETVTVGCCGDPIPTVLTAEFAGGGSEPQCVALNGLTFTLTYDSGTSRWLGSYVICGNTISFGLYCDGGGLSSWKLAVSASCITPFTTGVAASISSCVPLLLKFSMSISTCCPAACGFQLLITP